MSPCPLLKGLRLAAGALMLVNAAAAQAPPGYYASVDDTNPTALRSTLHAVIDDHQRFPYTSSSTDTWDILEEAQEDPSNSSKIIDVYRNASYTKIGGGVGAYNREHTWPKSYGFPDDGSDNYPYTDCHMLWLCDSGYNSSRSNKPYRSCSAGCNEQTTSSTNGAGGGSGVYPGNSNWTSGSFTSGTWEVWAGRRGDIARAMFYADLRYEGGQHANGDDEPDLILTNVESLIDNSNTGNNEAVAYMGMLSVLLAWHAEDPVSPEELARNDVVYSYQGNRNPFVDHPEWVDCLFQGSCGSDTTPPAVPTGLVGTPGDGSVSLDWADNVEPDLDGYDVLRANSPAGPFVQLNGAPLAVSAFVDVFVVNGTTYHYAVRARDDVGNLSADSASVAVTPAPPPVPEAMFSATPLTGTAPLAVSFTDLSTNTPTGWSWAFGDGGVSSASDPLHVYTTPGTFTVTLTVSNAFGVDTEVALDLVVVTPQLNPAVPGFDATPRVGPPPLTVQFTDQSQDGPTSWLWDFGDGATSTDPNPSHTYTGFGVYDVSLTVTNADGGSTLTHQAFVKSLPPDAPLGPTYLSFDAPTAVPGVGSVGPEDVVRYDPGTASWSLWFDGSDVGITADVDAVHVRLDGSLLLSFSGTATVPGLVGLPFGANVVEGEDLVEFVPTTVGASTSGSFSFYLDGSDLGLSGVDLIGVAESPVGGLALTFSEDVRTPAFGKLARDEAVLFFPTSLGSRSWGFGSILFDGSDVGLAGASPGGLAFDGADLLLAGIGLPWTTQDEDVLRFVGLLGADTFGLTVPELDGTALGLAAGAVIDAVSHVD